MSDLRNKIAHKIGNPKIFVYVVMWLIFLVLIGTIAQRDYGLYLVQQDYFYSWFKWFGFIPTPSVKLSVLILSINLSCYFFRKGICRINKVGISITHMGVILLLFGSGLTYIFSVEGNMLINENERSNLEIVCFDIAEELNIRDRLTIVVNVREFHDMQISIDETVENPIKTTAQGN